MSGSPIKKLILTPVVLSAAVFATLTLPLAVFGSKPMTIHLQDRPVFYGQLRDVAIPYLGLATALSVGAGLASTTVTGWRQSLRKSYQVKAQLSELTENLKEKEEQLEALKLSESRLQATGLNVFLDEAVPMGQAVKTPVANNASKVAEHLVITTAQSVEVQAVALPQAIPQVTGVQAAAAKFASAQAFLGYSQVKAAVKLQPKASETIPLELEALHIQIQQIMAQMASVQMALSATRPMETPEVKEVTAQPQLPVAQSRSVQEKEIAS